MVCNWKRLQTIFSFYKRKLPKWVIFQKRVRHARKNSQVPYPRIIRVPQIPRSYPLQPFALFLHEILLAHAKGNTSQRAPLSRRDSIAFQTIPRPSCFSSRQSLHHSKKSFTIVLFDFFVHFSIPHRQLNHPAIGGSVASVGFSLSGGDGLATTNFSAGTILYVNKVDIHGWLRVLTKGNKDAFLPEYTKVQITETKNMRVYFKVLDGSNQGMHVSLKEINAQEYLGRKAPLQTGVIITVKYGEQKKVESLARRETYLQQTAMLSVNGINAIVTLNTALPPPEAMHIPLPPGRYKIGLPSPIHDNRMTSFYRKTQPDLLADQIWFPIEYGNNSRFIHLGNISEGCVTVMALDKWNAVYQAIISHRVPNTNQVGYIVVSK